MANTDPTPVSRRHKRRKRQGYVRVEIQVRMEDTALVRNVAKALVDSERETETRAILREWFVAQRTGGMKALLAKAPLEGIDLERPRDFGRGFAP